MVPVSFLRGALVGTLCVALGGGGLAVAGDDDEDAGGDVEQPVDKRQGVNLGPGSGTRDVHREGDYGGVVPGKTGQGDKATRKKKARPAAPLVTWVGFQALEAGAARVFVQLSADAAYEQNVVGDALVVFLPGARLGTRNHGRFIDTSFFDTRVARIDASPVRRKRGRKAGVEISVRFKKGTAAQAQARAEQGPDGTRFIYLDFAP